MFLKTHSTSCLLLSNLLSSSRSILRCNASTLDGKMMNKVMGLSRKSKKVWYKSNVGANPTFEELMKQTTKNNAGRQSTKRINILNKLIMKNITDLMATGESSDKLIGYGLEITKVNIAGDYRSVNVYWLARKSEDDSQLHNLLHSISGPLRHELSCLRIMGEVPKIQFIKNKTYANVSAVDRLLNKADFGEDFVPTCPTLLNNYPIVFTNIDPEIKEKIKNLEDSENLEIENDEDIIPTMKMDVMGLDYSEIMTRLNMAIQKSKAVHRKSNVAVNDKNIASEVIEKPQYLSFKDFVKKRKIQEVKALGRRRSNLIEKEMYDNDISLYYEEEEEKEEDNKIDDYPIKF